MVRPLRIAVSVLIFLLLVLAAAGLSMLDLMLTEEPGANWAPAMTWVRQPLRGEGVSPDEPAPEEEARYRVTCRERDGEAREFFFAREPTREVLELHFAGCASVEVTRIEGDGGSAQSPPREWE